MRNRPFVTLSLFCHSIQKQKENICSHLNILYEKMQIYEKSIYVYSKTLNISIEDRATGNIECHNLIL